MVKQKRRDYQKNPIDLSKTNIKLEIDHSPLDPWQQEVMEYWGDIALCAGRQVGKSAVMALKTAVAACKYPKINILVSSGSERQAAYLYEKIKLVLKQIDEDVFATTPTMRLTRLKNGSEIYCLPTGQTGDLIRGLTLDIWIPDEAAYINDLIFATVSPMLWIAKQKGMGWTWALSTPKAKIGKFYECFTNPNFKKWRISAEDCKRIPEYELQTWKRQYTKLQYAQEVLGEFLDQINAFFPDSLLKQCFKEDLTFNRAWNRYLGVDVARYGGDSNAFVTCVENDKAYIVPYAETTERVGIHETFKKIIELETMHNYKKILIDDAGVGGGLTDFLIEKYKTKIVGINNAQRAVSADKTKKKKILKEDIYSNALVLMESGAVSILNNDSLYISLSSMLFEYDDSGGIKIYGRDSHLAEAYVRALWGAKRKGLNLWAESSKHGKSYY